MNNVEFKQILLNIISDNYGDTQRILKSICEEFDYDVNNDQWSYSSVGLTPSQQIFLCHEFSLYCETTHYGILFGKDLHKVVAKYAFSLSSDDCPAAVQEAYDDIVGSYNLKENKNKLFVFLLDEDDYPIILDKIDHISLDESSIVDKLDNWR